VTGWDSLWARYGPAMLVCIGALLLVQLAWLIHLQMRLKRTVAAYRSLLVGVEGASLESLLHTYAEQVRQTAARAKDLTADTERLSKDFRGCLQRFGVVRYNPFGDVGGDQSFAIALTDGLGNGFVVSSLHHRDRTQVYGKPLVNWTSPYALSDEETTAIEMARKGQDQG